MFGKKENKQDKDSKQTLGLRIAALRAAKNMKQNDLAERLGISAQAVSKWENDVSAPDISTLPALAKELGVSVDELLTGEKKEAAVRMLEPSASSRNLTLRIYVDSADGDRVRVNLPLSLVKAGLEMGVSMPAVTNNEAIKDVDFSQIIALVDQGLVGKLVEVDSADGDHVEIVVE